MPQIQSKIQPTIRTQPTTTTPPAKGATPVTSQQGILGTLQNTLLGFFKGIYNFLTSYASKSQTASFFDVQKFGTGTTPTQPKTEKTTPTGVFSPIAGKQFSPKIVPIISSVEEQLKNKPYPTQQFTPLTPERKQQILEDMQHEQAVQAARTGREIMSKVQKTGEAVLKQIEKTFPSITTKGATGKPLVETISGETSSENLITNLSQSPFAQDVQNLTTPPQTTTQTISNVPQGADVEIFRDPLGGSTPFFGYVIKTGDTLTKIARDFGVSVEDILRLNKDKTDAIKNVTGRPLGDIIIAGKEIRIPVVQKDIKQPPLLGQKVSSTDEINQKAKESLQTPQTTIDENKLNQLILEKTGIDISKIDTAINKLNQLNDPNFYANQYNQLLEKTGISKDIQALADIRSIMERTKQDVLEEAAKVGGLVTESQIAEVVNFRHGILKAQYQALADAIEAKERMVDNIMKYTAMDRKTIADLLESQLNLEKWKAELAMNAVKWDFNAQKELRHTNLKKLENYADAGELHTASADYLYNFVNPESPMYAGIDANELKFYIRMSQEKARQRELDATRTKQLIQNTLEEMQTRRAKEARALAKEEREKELHPLGKRKLEKLTEEGDDTLNPENF
jgi:LysM repeat protein